MNIVSMDMGGEPKALPSALGADPSALSSSGRVTLVGASLSEQEQKTPTQISLPLLPSTSVSFIRIQTVLQ